MVSPGINNPKTVNKSGVSVQVNENEMAGDELRVSKMAKKRD
ncbi:MAG: hypothetical protein WAL42_12690 [Nitrososphaeraceae archaeon]